MMTLAQAACLVLSLLVQQSTCTIYGDAIVFNECEEQVDDALVYSACTSSPAFMFMGYSNHTVTVSPENYTCGITEIDTFCTLGAVRDCGYCNNALEGQNHPPKYLIDQAFNDMHLDTWWQSMTWRDYPTPLEVNITMSFHKTYELKDDIKITFRTSRPNQMVIEKSLDFGATWQVWQYYDSRCANYFRDGIANVTVPVDAPETVICEQQYSQQLPYYNGQVVFPITSQRLGLYLGEGLSDYPTLYQAYNDTGLREFLTFTDIRIRLLKPMTDGQENTRNPTNLMMYYYAISNIEVTASCSCNLHAKFCSSVGGRMECECQHNTAGVDCEHCLPLYNNRPWLPGQYVPYPTGSANPCEKCECNEHTSSCTYNASLGFGECESCYHNTTGVHCQDCLPGYYRNSSLPLDHSDICIPCGCEDLGSTGQQSCDMVTGQCGCQDNVGGRRCDTCVNQFYGLLDEDNNPGTCKACACDTDGTLLQGNVCDHVTGQCPCKHTTTGRDCSLCQDGYYIFPRRRPFSECEPCSCNLGGSLSTVCDKITGACTCHNNVTGQSCDGTEPGFYTPSLDSYQLQPVRGSCDIQTALISELNPSTGRVYAECGENQDVQFTNINGNSPIVQPTVTWSFLPALRYTLYSTAPWYSAALELRVVGNSFISMESYLGLSSSCPAAGGDTFQFNITDLDNGIGKAWLSTNTVSLDARCVYRVKLTVLDKGDAISDSINIDSIVLLPDPRASTAFVDADEETMVTYLACLWSLTSLSTRQTSSLDSTCADMALTIMSELRTGVLPCECDPVGTVTDMVCAPVGGQCPCKPGVYGRQCNRCAPGYYNFTTDGCKACACDPNGSSGPVCDYITGQCPCRPYVAHGSQPSAGGDLTCGSCLRDYYGIESGSGCEACHCDILGINSTQCDAAGVCPCKPTITGQKCEHCQAGYFSRSATGCSECNCNEAGSESESCDQTTGQCMCKANTQGDKCDNCTPDSYNLQTDNPDGCQRCFCYGHSTKCAAASGYTSLLLSDDSLDVRAWQMLSPYGQLYPTHRSASSQYTGDKLSSYARYLTISLHSRTSQDVVLAGYKPVILEGNGQKVYYKSEEVISYTPALDLHILLHENYFYYNATSQPDYFNFYAILSDLQGLYIQQKFGPDMVHINSVSLETTADALPGDDVIDAVENCTCQTERNVTGSSCETCTKGHRRVYSLGGSYDSCILCDCNTRGETIPPFCDENTGVCLNCRDGTMGEQCEVCSAHVSEESGCTECTDAYWGLSQDGCQACDCDAIGSETAVCDAVRGECTCRSHVIGHKCHECQDNYYSLTTQGCLECDECYHLVMLEVLDLRQMRDTFDALVTLLMSNDNNTRLRANFIQRLESTVNDMGELSGFLDQANTVQLPVSVEIAELNTTLTELRNILDLTILTAISDSSVKSNMTDYLLAEMDSIMKHINGAMANNHITISAFIHDNMAELRSFLENLNSSYILIAETAAVSSGQGQQLNNTANTITNMTAGTKTQSEQSLQAVIDDIAQHENNTIRISDLQLFITLTNDMFEQKSLTSQTMEEHVIEMMERTNEAEGALSVLMPLSGEVVIVEGLINSVRNNAASLLHMASTLSTEEQETVDVDTAEAVRRSQALAHDIHRLDQDYQHILGHLESLQTSASDAQNLSSGSLNQAQNMLQIMSNFTHTALAAEARANISLSTVQEVTSLSQLTAASAEELSASLQGAFSDSQSAIQGSSAGSVITSANLQSLLPLSHEAEDMQSLMSESLSGIEEQRLSLGVATFTQAAPAQQACSDNLLQVELMEENSTQALSNALDVSTKVDDVEARLKTILQEIQNVNNINSNTISELRTLVGQTHADFERTGLSSAVSGLKTLVEERRQWIDNMNHRKQLLKAQIQRLMAVQAQLTDY